MTTIMTTIYSVALLGVLIFVHELGHFLLAKLCGVKVLKFSLGMGPKLFGKTVGETEYLLSIFPVGGYVKMHGEDLGEAPVEADRERSFPAQPVYKRALIVVAGSVFNLIFAVVLFSGIYMYGVPRLNAIVGVVMKDTPAMRAGMKGGDAIIEIDGAAIKFWDEMTAIIHQSPGKRLKVKVESGGAQRIIEVTPEAKPSKNLFGEQKTVGLIGITPEGGYQLISYGPFKAVYHGARRTWEIIDLTLTAVVKLIQRVLPSDTIGGPIMIFQLAGKQANEGLMNFLTLMAVISINLGVFNLFPIPILDGGTLVFLFVESARKKPLGERVVEISQKVGLTLLLMLMALALYNDVYKLITGQSLP
jgi:regulator of sigma E protease